VQAFKVFEETPEYATKGGVHFMNEMNLGVSIEDVDELVTSYSEPVSMKISLTYKRKIKTPPEADCQEAFN
jgi:hypothetical protein